MTTKPSPSPLIFSRLEQPPHTLMLAFGYTWSLSEIEHATLELLQQVSRPQHLILDVREPYLLPADFYTVLADYMHLLYTSGIPDVIFLARWRRFHHAVHFLRHRHPALQQIAVVQTPTEALTLAQQRDLSPV